MHSYENLPSEWFSSRKRPRSYHYLPPMSQPVSKSFNRISDFIFPDTVHIRLQQQQQQPMYHRYERTENYSLPVLNHRNLNQHDLIVVERLPFEELNNVDFLYREQYQRQQQQQQHYQQQRYQPIRPVRRRYTSIIDERRVPSSEKISPGLTSRAAAYRERIRDRRKRHTTDNAYHSMMKSMLEEDESQYTNGGPNYILSYTTTLDPITDSESINSVHQQQQQQQQQQKTNDISLEEWKRQTHGRVPINGTVPVIFDRERPRQRHHSSSLSSRDSSSDTDITERHPTTTSMNYTSYQQDTSFIASSKELPAIAIPRPAVWERLESEPIRFRHQPDIFIPIIPTAVADTNNQETLSYSNNLITSSPFDKVVNHQINNQTSSQLADKSAHHVSLCVNDLHTTLFIDQDALNSTKTTTNSNNNGGKVVIRTFIDRIIKRLQHFKRSLDSGLVHVRKRNTLVNGPIVTADYRIQSETTRRKLETERSNDYLHQQNIVHSTSLNTDEENKVVRPYFLIRPQSVLVLPNEIAKFKCCFGGESLPTIVWSHNNSRIPEIIAAGGATSSQYRIHKLHDIHYLDIGPVTDRDNGQIQCTLMNRYGREEAIAQLIVAPTASDATPSITQSLNDITIIEGCPLKLSCGIIGLQITVNWFHNGKLISPMTQSKTDYHGENAIFSLSRCMRSDAGTVDCLVKNRFGEARTSCRVEVVNDPEFDRRSYDEVFFNIVKDILMMSSLLQCPVLSRTLTIDDISKKPHCKNLKFKRAFQFLQLLLIQRVYGIDVITCSALRRASKTSQREEEQQQQQQGSCEVFLGGSCNPTTWRHDQAIPYFQSRSVSFYNPQVADWTPDLVEIEHRAKELAPLLFFVIDNDTRALASIVEVCFLAARGRSIIVVMNPMSDSKHAKFIQHKKCSSEKDDEDDYENVCDARRTLRTLLQSMNIPVFDNVGLALECAAFILETTKRTMANHNVCSEDNKEDNGEQDVLTPLPRSSGDCNNVGPSSVVVIRSLSNKTVFESADEFYQQMHQTEIPSSHPNFHRRHSATLESNSQQFRPTPVCTRSQLSSSTNESDDDGYCSLSSSNRTLSSSSLSLSSESFEPTTEQQREDHLAGPNHVLPISMMNNLISRFYSYIPFVSPSKPPDSSVTQSLFVLFTLPFRYIKDTLLSPTALSPLTTVFSPSEQSATVDLPSPIPSLSSTHHMFDLYIASGENDECWLNTFALPTLEKVNITFTKRQSYHENDPLDALYDLHVRKQSRVLFYLINGNERLSTLATELAFLAGERKHKIIVYLQVTLDENIEQIRSACERRDIQRSRKYLEDLVRKENITLCHSREQSWQHVLSFFHQGD